MGERRLPCCLGQLTAFGSEADAMQGVMTDRSGRILLKNSLSHSRSAFIKVGIWETCLF